LLRWTEKKDKSTHTDDLDVLQAEPSQMFPLVSFSKTIAKHFLLGLYI